MKRLISILMLLMTVGCMTARVTYTREDSLTVVRLLSEAPGPDVLWLARQLIDRPYVAHTLEVNDREQLVVNTRQLDCTTLVETVAALAICVKEKKRDFCSFCQVLRVLRYRDGKLNGYTSRLHYFTDWIDDNSRLGLVAEVKKQASPFTAVQTVNVNYMSTHPTAYKALKAHPELVKTIAQQEQALTGRKYRYIPKAKVQNTQELRSVVHDGDIIAITCSKPGLDIAHLGFAVWRKDGLHLLNASQLHKKVVEEPMTLGQYLQKHPTHTGIRVVRLNIE
ncbi:MAG: DUF1460 domain-containing protein [Prevotella sp.]|nr:DUF1460 domain-containing protein [Prevotella sp.]